MILSISKPNHTSIQPDDNECFFITKTHFHNQKSLYWPSSPFPNHDFNF